MNSIFNPDSFIMRFLSRVFDVMYLNILCLICCIPIVTIGPSITALYYCMLKILRERDSSISKMFFHSFKRNLKQGILLTLLFAVITAVLLADIHICTQSDVEFLQKIKLLLYVLFFVFISVVSYTFPILAQFDNTSKNILKYSFLIAIYNYGYTVLIVLLNSIPVVLFLVLPELFLLTLMGWLTFGFSFIALVNSKFFLKIFKKLIPECDEP